MSTDISDVFINQYEAEVNHVFQRKGAYLLPTVRVKGGVKGQSILFPKMGKGTATTKSRHGTITPMNVSHEQITLTPADFYAGDWNDKLDNYKTNIDERMNLAKAGAGALGRKIDNQILNELDNTSQTAVTVTVTSFAAVRNGFINATEDLNDNDVPADDERFGLMTNRLWSQLMNVDQFIRSDYNGPDDLPYVDKAYVGKRFRSWLGVHWQAHNDCPGKGTSTAKGFVYHRQSIAYGYSVLVEGMDEMRSATDVTWHGDRQAWFIAQVMSGACKIIDDTGIIETNHNDTTGIATS